MELTPQILIFALFLSVVLCARLYIYCSRELMDGWWWMFWGEQNNLVHHQLWAYLHSCRLKPAAQLASNVDSLALALSALHKLELNSICSSVASHLCHSSATIPKAQWWILHLNLLLMSEPVCQQEHEMCIC